MSFSVVSETFQRTVEKGWASLTSQLDRKSAVNLMGCLVYVFALRCGDMLHETLRSHAHFSMYKRVEKALGWKIGKILCVFYCRFFSLKIDRKLWGILLI